MSDKYKNFFRILFNAILAMYPVLFFVFLIILKVPIRIFSLFIIALALFEFVFKFSERKNDNQHRLAFLNSLFLLVIGVLCFIINTNTVFKFFPMLMNIILLYSFGITLFQPPTMIYRFAVLADKTIPKSLGEKKIASYCYKVTVLWVVFFIVNGSIAALTVFFVSDFIWFIYNGVFSGVLVGTIFTCEFIVRKIVQRKIPKAVPLSSFNKKSRNFSSVMCYEGAWSDGIYKTYGDFLKGTSVLRKEIEAAGGTKWLLYCEDYWHFLLAFTALLQCKKEIMLSANVGPAYIAEIKEDANFITDHIFPLDSIYGKTLHIPAILSQNDHQVIGKCPKIIRDETAIVLFTFGSTGTPKKIKQRLTELENDNAFILSMWGEELISRKICSTLNQHHIYGLIFSILLPFTAGIPFRRQMIRFPEEFLKLTDTEYTIATVPAFLKQGVEVLKPNELNLKSPRIFVSDGVLNPELAKKTDEIFGFWPLEIYGSTETSGIAWRQSNKGTEWTPAVQ